MPRWACAAGAALAILCVSSPAVAHHGAPHAPYAEPVGALESAAQCRAGAALGGFDVVTGAGRSEPVLLVHGSGVTREENWSWNWWPWLADAGFEVCWLQLPETGYADLQTSAEYIAYAVRRMAAVSEEKVDVLGHSSGALTPRWTLRYFAAAAAVDDFVGLAAPNHGTVVFDVETATGSDFPAAWQMRSGSQFLSVLNSGDETPGRASYTSIYTAFDELVQPVGTQRLEGASNVLLQEVCPARPVDHFTIVADGVAHLLALDALVRHGPADVRRAAATCTEAFMPGATPPESLENHDTPMTDHEPPVRGYARER